MAESAPDRILPSPRRSRCVVFLTAVRLACPFTLEPVSVLSALVEKIVRANP